MVNPGLLIGGWLLGWSHPLCKWIRLCLYLELCQRGAVVNRQMYMRVVVIMWMIVAAFGRAAGPVMQTTFTAQMPLEPGVYDAPATSTRASGSRTAEE